MFLNTENICMLCDISINCQSILMIHFYCYGFIARLVLYTFHIYIEISIIFDVTLESKIL